MATDMLRRLAARCPTADDLAALAAAAAARLEDGTPLDEALGLVRRRARGEMKTRRDELIRAMAQEFWPLENTHRKAAKFGAALDGYQRSHWEADRVRGGTPNGCQGTERERLFEILSTGETVPRALSTLQSIISPC